MMMLTMMIMIMITMVMEVASEKMKVGKETKSTDS